MTSGPRIGGRRLRVVFFGSPDYALPTLRLLLASADIEVVAVVSQPDRPRGRSGAPAPTAVSSVAREAGVETLTPERIRLETTERLRALRPDVGVLAASGHILPTHLLEAFPHGVLNVHASLLPRHRGASPVAAAILAGDEATGASIMLVVRELDAGPVLGTVTTPIGPLDTTGTLTTRVAELGALRMLELLPGWVAGEVDAEPQDESLTSYAPRLTKQDGVLDWTQPAEALARRVRAFQPWPLATTSYRGDTLTVHEAWPLATSIEAPAGAVFAGDGSELTPLLPGRRATAVVACGEGSLALLRVQRPGKRALDIEEYLRGDVGFIGTRLGQTA
ncbi:MAG: methionyl-tRNA formyltransferase [Dehalococcoidia bacterium]|nr:methionyl-tRNA formyltransferase [Dehalococcoidia bacterium]